MIDTLNQTEEFTSTNSQIEVPEFDSSLNNQSISEDPISHCETASTNCTEESENGGYFYKVCG